MHQNHYGPLDTRANRLVTHNRTGGLCLGVRALVIPFKRHGVGELNFSKPHGHDLFPAIQFKPTITYMKLA